MMISEQLVEFSFHNWAELTDKDKTHFQRMRNFPCISFNKETHISCICVFQSLIFLGCVAAAGLGVNLLCLAIYMSCLCCCRKDEEEEESKKSNSCCVTWAAVAAGLICWYVPPTVLTLRG